MTARGSSTLRKKRASFVNRHAVLFSIRRSVLDRPLDYRHTESMTELLQYALVILSAWALIYILAGQG